MGTVLETFHSDDHRSTCDLSYVYKNPVANGSAPLPDRFRQWRGV